MGVRLTLQGHDGFLNTLRTLPDDIAREVRGLVYGAANKANERIKPAYPPRDPASRSRFPPLASTMIVENRDPSPWHPRAVLNQTSVLGQWYEVGTPDRFTRTGKYRGKMPAAPTFVPPAIQERRTMYYRIDKVLGDLGFRVTW